MITPILIRIFIFPFLQSPEPSGIIDLRTYHVTEGNYTKRKHVFKLSSAPLHATCSVSNITTSMQAQPTSSSSSSSSNLVFGTELLIQADSHQDMKLWMETLRKASSLEATNNVVSQALRHNPWTNCDSNRNFQEYSSKFGTQTAEPQRVAASQTIQTQQTGVNEDVSPLPPSKSVRKYLGSRSPSGQSPVTKSRKTPQLTNISTSSKETTDKEIGSPKSRTWKGLVARQFRKIQGQPSSPNSNYVQLPEGASIGVPLAQCPMVCSIAVPLLYVEFH